ncbi:MAG TPA: phage/plasmid primase, P4 family [Bryobacteraceae bacterium]|nr:phage/plasmid primase, P4 family [Bryobacteraceae bacterium]
MHVVLWPDRDAPGQRLAQARADMLAPIAGSVRIISPPDDLPEGGDIIDGIGLGWDAARIERLTGQAKPAHASAAVVQAPPSLTEHPLNDYGNAQRIIAVLGQRLRYCHAFNKWLFWDERRWLVDSSDKARCHVHEVFLEFARQALASGNSGASKFAGSSMNSQRVTAALREAQPHLAINVENLDQDPWLLNFRNGTIDLRTGHRRPHDPRDFITKMVPHDFRPDASCPRWLKFQRRIMAANEQMIRWKQKAWGYTLTGSTAEKAVFIAHGSTGSNGKTTELAFFRQALGDDYAVLLQIDSLMAKAESNNTQADLADLRGARFAMTSETEEGQRLAEGKLKRITQGTGKIKAARKYENPIEFLESHKLWLDANHKPVIRGTDAAIWNRLFLIPYEVTIPTDEIDRDLPAKLLEEAEGILAWAVAGAVRWHSEGLGRPDEVASAVKDWRSDADQIGQFLSECCVIGDYGRVKARPLYKQYRDWAEGSGERDVVTETAFGLRMTQQGYQKKREESGVFYLGLGLRSSDRSGE